VNPHMLGKAHKLSCKRDKPCHQGNPAVEEVSAVVSVVASEQVLVAHHPNKLDSPRMA